MIWLYGYGFPRYKGGPMFQGMRMGEENVQKALAKLRTQAGDKIWPEVDTSPLSE